MINYHASTIKTLHHIAISVLIAGVLFSCRSGDYQKTGADGAAKAVAKQKNVSAKKATSSDSSAQGADARQGQRKLIVYYLHTTFRCFSCTKIERLTKEAVGQGFAEQLKKGRIEMKVVNVEEPWNEHFVDDYKLYTKSVILSDILDGKEVKWKNLDQVWTLLNNEGKFIEYIRKEIKTFLEG